MPYEDVDTNESSISNNLTSTIEDSCMLHSLIVDFDSLNNLSKPAEQVTFNKSSENNYVLSRVFLDLFPLGYSCNEKEPLPKRQVKHLLHQFTGNFAVHPHLYFYLLNQMQRHGNMLGIHSK